MSKMSKACDISPKVKNIVWERDNYRCIICGSSQAMPNSHYIKRSHGGLGIPENIATMCLECHTKYDLEDEETKERFKAYLQNYYPDWDEQKLYYDKWSWTHESK